MSVLFERFRPTFENNLLIRGKYFKDLLDQDLRTKMYADRMKQMEEDVMPFGIVNNGINISDNFVDSDGQTWTYV